MKTALSGPDPNRQARLQWVAQTLKLPRARLAQALDAHRRKR